MGSQGQLGLGDLSKQFLPVLVTAKTKYVQVASGRYHMIALGDKGEVYTWGDNSKGQLGYGSSVASGSPIRVFTRIHRLPVIQVAAGDYSSYALTSDGNIYSWGDNSVGQLGTGSTSSLAIQPTLVSGLKDVKISSIGAGSNTVFAVASNGTTYSWGLNTNYQANDGSKISKNVPTLVVNPFPSRKIVGASSGNVFSVFLLNGTYCFGYAKNDSSACSSHGSCEDTDTCVCEDSYSGLACEITTCYGYNNTDSRVCSGRGTCIAFNLCVCDMYYMGDLCESSRSGYLYTIGSNSEGQLGDDSYDDRLSLKQPADPFLSSKRIKHVAAGSLTSFALTEDGELYSWGQGLQWTSGETNFGTANVGLLGDGTIVQRRTPQRIMDSFPKIVHMCVSTYHVAVVAENNQVYSWGINTVSQKLSCTFYTSVYPIATTSCPCPGGCGDKSGVLGNNSYYHSNTPISVFALPDNYHHGDIVELACGTAHTLARTSNGSVYGWGYNAYGQIGDPSYYGTTVVSPTLLQLNQIVLSISAGETYSMALTSRGKIYVWGGNSRGQRGDGTTRSNNNYLAREVDGVLSNQVVIKIAAGRQTLYALTKNGYLYAWGDNSNGQLGLNITIPFVSRPSQVAILRNVSSIATGFWTDSVQVSTRTGESYAWGSNYLSPELNATIVRYPLEVAKSQKRVIRALSFGYSHSLVVFDDVYSDGCFGISSNSSNVCSGNGSCIDVDTCSCHQGFSGLKCEFTSCFGYNMTDTNNVCSGRGECVALNICECSPAMWSGAMCQNFVCFNLSSDNPDVCSSNGTCIDVNTCECSHGFSGNNCEFTSCFGYNMTDFGTVCSGRGECISLDTCICDEDAWGYECQNFSCFGVPSQDADVCSSRGSCIGPGVCNCSLGYTGEYCQFVLCHGTSSNDSQVCSGHGHCASPDVCVCESSPSPGYTGGDCSYPICYSRYLDKLGSNEGVILQPPPFSKDLVLEIDKVCSGHGECISPNNCSCAEGYTDSFCSTPVCFGVSATDPASCNNGINGTCVAPNNCTCLLEFDAHGDCTLLTCFGRNSSSNPSSCNSHLKQGNCINVDVCACAEGYGGLECEQTVCNGILEFNTTHVCHGRGECQEPDRCTCYPGFNGTDCQFVSCFGKLDTNHSVCSARGLCHSPDHCVCDAGYGGEECQYLLCHGQLSNDISKVCSGHGTCVAIDDCQCFKGWTGLNCSQEVILNPALIITQEKIGVCDNIALVAVSNETIDKYWWSLVSGSNQEQINDFLRKWMFNSSVTIPFTMLNDTEFIFNLTLMKDSKVSAPSSILITRQLSSMFELSIKGAPLIPVHIGKPIIIEGDINPVSCMIGQNVSFVWEQIEGQRLSFSQNEKTVILPSTTFISLSQPELKQKFSLRLTARSGLFEEHASVTIRPIPTPLTAFIQGGDRKVSEVDEIILDGSHSIDPDNTNELSSFSWLIHDTDKNSTVELPGNISKHTSILIIPARTLSIGNYQFSLNFTKSYRTDTHSVMIQIVSTSVANLNVVLLTENIYVANRAKPTVIKSRVTGSRGRVQYRWSETSNKLKLITGKTIGTFEGAPNLILLENILTPGTNYSFQLSVSDSWGSEGKAIVTLSVREAPQKGQLDVVNNNSTRLYYRLTASQFGSAGEILRYLFGYYDEETPQKIYVPLQDRPSLGNTLDTALPTTKNGTLLVTVFVYDWLDAMTQVTVRVNTSILPGYSDDELKLKMQSFRADIIQGESNNRELVSTTAKIILTTLNNQKNMSKETSEIATTVREALIVALNNATQNMDLMTEESLLQQSTLCYLLTSDSSQTSDTTLRTAVSFIEKLIKDMKLLFVFDTAKALSMCSSNIFQGLKVARNRTSSTTLGQVFRKNFQSIESIGSAVLENIVAGTTEQILQTDTFSASIFRDTVANINNSTIRIEGVTDEMSTSIFLPSSFNSINKTQVFESTTNAHDIGVRAFIGPSPYFDFSSNQNITSPVLSLTFEQGDKQPSVRDLIEPIIFNIPIPSPGLTLSKLNRNESEAGYRPFCKFWDEKRNSWNTTGCKMIGYTKIYVTCACNHTTNFAAFIDYAIPNLQFLNAQDFRNITKLNKDNMATVILMASLALCYIALVILILIYRLIKRSYVRYKKQQLDEDERQMRRPKKEKSKGKLRHLIVSYIYEHPYFSLFMGGEESLGKIRQLTLIYVGILGMFTGNAITFGTENENGIQFLVSSVVSELVATPFVIFFTTLFVSTRPFKPPNSDDNSEEGESQTKEQYQSTNYPRMSRFHGKYTPTTVEDSPMRELTVAPKRSKYSKLKKQLLYPFTKMLDVGDTVSDYILLHIIKLMDTVTWQGAIFLMMISLLYGGCVVGIMYLFQWNFGSWFNTDYQIGFGTLFIVAYFVFLEVTYLRIRYNKFVERDTLIWRPNFKTFSFASLASLFFLLLACGLIPVLLLVTPHKTKHPWFLRVLFIECGLVVVALSGIIFMAILLMPITHASVADEDSNSTDKDTQSSVSNDVEMSDISLRYVWTDDKDGHKSTLDIAPASDIISTTRRSKSVLYYLSKWWNAEYWFPWPCLFLWYPLFALYVAGCSFILVLYGIKFEHETKGWVLGCGTGVAEDVFVKPVIEFMISNVIYIAIIEFIAGMFFRKRKRFVEQQSTMPDTSSF